MLMGSTFKNSLSLTLTVFVLMSPQISKAQGLGSLLQQGTQKLQQLQNQLQNQQQPSNNNTNKNENTSRALTHDSQNNAPKRKTKYLALRCGEGNETFDVDIKYDTGDGSLQRISSFNFSDGRKSRKYNFDPATRNSLSTEGSDKILEYNDPYDRSKVIKNLNTGSVEINGKKSRRFCHERSEFAEFIEKRDANENGFDSIAEFRAAKKEGFKNAQRYKLFKNGGFADKPSFETALNANYKTASDYKKGKSLGFNDGRRYARFKKGGFKDPKIFNRALKAGYSTASDYKTGTENGFKTGDEYRKATAAGFKSSKSFLAAQAAGFKKASDFKAAQRGGFKSATEFQTAKAAGFGNAKDYSTALSNGLKTKSEFDQLSDMQKDTACWEQFTSTGAQDLAGLIVSGFDQDKLRALYKAKRDELDRKKVLGAIKAKFPKNIYKRCLLMGELSTKNFSVAKFLFDDVKEKQDQLAKEKSKKDAIALKPFKLWISTYKKLNQGLEDLAILEPESEKYATKMINIYGSCLTEKIQLTPENIDRLEKVRKCLSAVEGEFNKIGSSKSKKEAGSAMVELSQYTLRNYYEEVTGIKKAREKERKIAEQQAQEEQRYAKEQYAMQCFNPKGTISLVKKGRSLQLYANNSLAETFTIKPNKNRLYTFTYLGDWRADFKKRLLTHEFVQKTRYRCVPTN